MKPKNVLAILGSPHSKGVTAAMLDYSIREAEKAGYCITKINLYEKQLAFCTGCRVCLTSGMCVQNDAIQEIILTACWELLWKKQRHFQNQDCPGKGICS